MTIGDCYILSSEFHNMDIGLIFLGETKSELFFTPLNFKNHRFDFTHNGVLEGKLQTNQIFSGTHNAIITGIYVIQENKKKPSFLTKYCTKNKPFLHLNINTNKYVLGQVSTDKNQLIIGSGGSFPSKKEDFDKFAIHSITTHTGREQSDLDLILIS